MAGGILRAHREPVAGRRGSPLRSQSGGAPSQENVSGGVHRTSRKVRDQIRSEVFVVTSSAPLGRKTAIRIAIRWFRPAGSTTGYSPFVPPGQEQTTTHRR